MKITLTLSEQDLTKMITADLEEKWPGKEIEYITFDYDRPTNPTPTDQGTGVSARVRFKE